MSDTPAAATLLSAGAAAPPAPPEHFSLSVTEAWHAYRADPHWVRKSLLGGLASAVPLLGTLGVSAWLVGYERRVAWGKDRPLPPVGELEPFALRALYLFVGSLVWALPLYAILFVSIFVFVAALGLFIALAASGRPGEGIAGIVLLSVGFAVVISLVAIAYSLVLQAAVARFALYDRLDAFWQVREILATLKGTWKPLLWATLRVWLLSMAVVFALEIAYFLILFAFGALALLLFLPVASSGGSGHDAAATLAIGGVLLAQMGLWLSQLLLMVALFVVLFPIRTIATHVYGQWTGRVYGLDASAAPPAA